MIEDRLLLRRYSDDRDEAAFAELVRRHLPLVYHTALRHVGGDRQGAEDIAQIVFTDLARKADKLSHYSVLGGWLYARARHAGMAATRTKVRRRAREEKAEQMKIILADPDAVPWENLRPVIDQALEHLSTRDRDAIILRYFESRSFAEVGARVGLSEDAARMRVDRALEKLRSILARNGVASTVAALAIALAAQAGAAFPLGLAASVTGTALAGAVAPAGGAVLIIQLLTAPKVLLGAAALVGLIGVGICAVQLHEAETTRVAAAQIESENNSLAADLRRMDARSKEQDGQIGSLRAQLAALKAQADKLRQEHTRQLAAKQGKKSKEDKSSAINWEASKDPAIRAALKASQWNYMQIYYGKYLSSLGLSQAQIDAAVDRMIMAGTYNFGGVALTLRPEDETRNDVLQSLHQILDDSTIGQLWDYHGTMFVSSMATALAGALYDSDSPLSTQQAAQLTQLIAQDNSRPPNSGPPYPNSVDWMPILEQAQSFLNPEQLAVLENQVTVMMASPGPWGTMDPNSPGALGTAPIPPLGFLISQQRRGR